MCRFLSLASIAVFAKCRFLSLASIAVFAKMASRSEASTGPGGATAMVVLDAAEKRRRVSRAQTETGADNLLNSASDKSRAYIQKTLEGVEADELASLIADMLRDGDLHRALERKRKSSTIRALGPVLVVNRKGGTCWKMMGRRFDRELVEMMIGGSLYGKDVASLKLVSSKRYSQLVAFALNQLPTTQVPSSHSCAQYEAPLKAVAMLRYVAMGSRLQSLCKDNVQSMAYFSWDPAHPEKISCPVMKIAIALPFSAEELEEHADWEVVEGWSLKEAHFQSKSGGRSQAILPLVRKQHPLLALEDEEASFEFPDGADAFQMVPGSTAPAVSPRTPTRTAATLKQVAAAGSPPVIGLVPLPPVT
jgi:hypothetical protein